MLMAAWAFSKFLKLINPATFCMQAVKMPITVGISVDILVELRSKLKR